MLEIGFGIVTITPPLGTPLGGYEHRKYNTIGIHDDVHARCILFRENESNLHIALIVCDLLWVSYDFSDKISDYVEKITKGVVKKENVIVHAIHTHSSQRITTDLDFFYDRIKKPHNFDKGWYTKFGVSYHQYVIATSVYGALQNLQLAVIKYNWGKTDIGHNRRYDDPASKIVDRDLFSMVFLNKNDKLYGSNIRGIFFNLANHCVAMGEENYLISRDWPYFSEKILKQAFHLDWRSLVIFGQGTAGNTNPWNCRFNQEDREIYEAEKVGRQAAADVISTLKEENLKNCALPDMKSDLKIKTSWIHVEINDPVKVKMFRDLKLDFMGSEEIDDKYFLNVKISIIKLNNIIFACVPGEPFGEFGVKIKEAIKKSNPQFEPIVLELCDGAIGYIITRDSYNNTKGYEESLAASAETGYLIIEEIKKMIQKF
ncbi:MAG: neutral/alkaline non-lysosomal ceramidase N-terminal domain-containing protein [Promethearchaeota archaeon]